MVRHVCVFCRPTLRQSKDGKPQFIGTTAISGAVMSFPSKVHEQCRNRTDVCVCVFN